MLDLVYTCGSIWGTTLGIKSFCTVTEVTDTGYSVYTKAIHMLPCIML